MPRHLGSVIGVWLLFLFGSLGNGHAYVRTRTNVSCRLVRWEQSCIYVQPDAEYQRDERPTAEVLSDITMSINSWNDRLFPTGFVRFVQLSADDSREASQTDRLNYVKFRFGFWGRPATETRSKVPFDSSAAGLTTVSWLNKPDDPGLDGRLVDADIDLNAVHFRFVDAAQTASFVSTDNRRLADLRWVMTHELGHVLGLDHTCSLDPLAATCETDQRGNKVPSCEQVDVLRPTTPAMQTAFEALMYPNLIPSEQRRAPTSDDLAGILDTYPAYADPQQCSLPAVVAGCEVASAKSRRGIVTLFWGSGILFALLALNVRFSRRKSSKFLE